MELHIDDGIAQTIIEIILLSIGRKNVILMTISRI